MAEIAAQLAPTALAPATKRRLPAPPAQPVREPLALTAETVCNPIARARLAERMLDGLDHQYAPGTVQRSRFLLHAMDVGHPSARVRAAYMENLRLLLRSRPARNAPGRLVIAMGTGRCGSTSLCHILSGCADACATHENPPMLYWKPRPEQIAFHLQRFALLRRYFGLTADAAHWWINATDALVRSFPDIRFIGLIRDRDACVDSFLRIKGVGQDTINHWLPPGTPGQPVAAWDLAYPSYRPSGPETDQEADGKRTLIGRYVDEYNARLERLAAADPRRWLLLRTEALDAPETRLRIYAHAGAAGHFVPVRLNAGTTEDGMNAYRF
jgi:hypothetical protein